jgi:hypothetical protein
MTKQPEGGLKPVGDLLSGLNLPKKPVLTPVKQRMLDAAVTIQDNPDAVERAFMARQLVLCTFPHSDPGNMPRWLRRSGTSSLLIQPGWDVEHDRPIGYPYGTIPRLLMFWITTELQHTKNRSDLSALEKRTLYLGSSLSAFMRQLGLDPSRGGVRSDGKRLHDQMDRLFASRISFHQTVEVSDQLHGHKKATMEVASESELWWNPKHPEQEAFWQSWIRVGEALYEALVDIPVPMDMRALRALKNSALALDLYAWVCYRAFIIVKKNQPPRFMSWTVLTRQLGTDYADPKDFKKKAKAALRKVATLYPGLTIRYTRGGFAIHATRLAVPQLNPSSQNGDRRA